MSTLPAPSPLRFPAIDTHEARFTCLTPTSPSPSTPPIAGAFHPPAQDHAPKFYPQEQGAYAILGVPLVAALIMAQFNGVASLIALAAVSGFVAHEPLLIATGRRGKRFLAYRSAAWRRFAASTGLAVTAGSAACLLGTGSVRWALTACLLAAAAALWQAFSGWQRSLTAQLTAIATLTIPTAAVLLAGGYGVSLAVQVWLIWVLGRMATSVAVKSALASHRASSGYRVPPINDLLQGAASLGCVAGLVFGSPAWILSLPLLAAGLWLRLQRPANRNLKTVGWSLLAVNVGCGLGMLGWFAG